MTADAHLPWTMGELPRRPAVENARRVARFGVTVGLAAIFIDASIAHGLFWENDPYWTYWITKTFLITTVFTLGTALLGIGLWQGLVITAVHTLILEIYYQWFAPVGLPQEPEWLDFNHLWTTGVPAHYLAIYGGYLIAWWVWRRHERVERIADADTTAFALFSLLAAVVVVVLDGIITNGILLRSFPGLTYFVQRLLIAFVILYGFTTYVGFDVRSWIAGSALLALVWITYGMYLGPVGLPTRPPTYLGYSDLWLKSFPGAIVSVLIGLWLTLRFLAPHVWRMAPAAERLRP